jgi:hypothetical protein
MVIENAKEVPITLGINPSQAIHKGTNLLKVTKKGTDLLEDDKKGHYYKSSLFFKFNLTNRHVHLN